MSSQLDVDRLDYLLRDGHYSGAGYATYDLDWIIHAIQVANVRGGQDDPSDLVVDYRRGMYAVEQYLFARSYMYAQVYHHKTVRAAEWMFIKTLERFAAARARRASSRPGCRSPARWRAAVEVAVDDYLRLHDISVTTALDRWAGRDGPRRRRSGAARSVGAARRPPAVQDVRSRRRPRAPPSALWPQALEVAEQRFGAAARSYVHLDTARQVGYLASDDEELHVIDHPRYGAVTLSRLLEDMPLGQPMAAIRLVCAPELVDDLRPLVEHALGRGRGRR